MREAYVLVVLLTLAGLWAPSSARECRWRSLGCVRPQGLEAVAWNLTNGLLDGPLCRHEYRRGSVHRCEANLENLIIGIEMHPGGPPARLEDLVPGTLLRLPDCPTGARYRYTVRGEHYTLSCTGWRHPEHGAPDRPAATEAGILPP